MKVFTRKDVAQRAGCSLSTVTRVTSGEGYVSSEIRKKVLKAIEELNYRPNPVAQNLRTRKNNIIAVLFEDFNNPYTAESVEYFAHEAGTCGYTVMLFIITKDNADNTIAEILHHNINRIINCSLVDIGDKNRELLSERKFRTVNIFEKNNLHQIIDYEPAMRKIYEKLRRDGKKRVAYIGGMIRFWMMGDNRVQTFQKLNKEFGMECDEDSIVSGDYPAQKYYEIGYYAAKELLKKEKPVEAIFCLTDAIAVGVLRALGEIGKSVPQDVAVIGCDNITISAMTNPPLTTLAGMLPQLAKEYIRYIISDEEGGVRSYRSELISRDTV